MLRLFLVTLLAFSATADRGAFKPVPIDDNIKQLAWDAIDQSINPSTNSITKWVLVKVEKAALQIVTGNRYRITLTTGESVCRKNDNTPLDKCRLNPDGMYNTCEVEVFQKKWENVEDIETLGCHQVPKPKLGETDQEELELLFAWNEFKTKYNKIYPQGQQEDQKRFEIFKENMKMAAMYQALERGTARYGMTVFSDMTQEEFRQTMLSPIVPNSNMQQAEIPVGDVPDEVDWRSKNVVTDVKNQGQCGSCWAFSTTGNIEGQWAIKKGSLVSLSEQQLVDCDKIDHGCQGGLMSDAYKEIMRMGGLESEKDYPYKGWGVSCNFDASKIVAYINGSQSLSKDEGDLVAWCAANGPIAAAINAGPMQWYMGGVAHPWKIMCNPKKLDHGVLIAGYGKDGDKPYWLVKNSWGKIWGEHGYYRIYRGDGSCGLNTMCSSSVVN